MQLTESNEQHRGHDRFMQAIAVFKFVKAILFVLAALGAFGLMQHGVAEQARDWGSALAFTSGQHLVRTVVTFLTGLSRAKIGALGLGALFYAALFTTEGIGLWRERRWAEYLTVIATGSLIPFEIWEIAHRPTPLRFATFIVNVVVVIYLVVRLRRPRASGAHVVAMPNAAATERAPERSRAG
ncbi:MAG: DUF2127 domain-containing protein [Gemmatimonadetes bacterium]|jgi:uncharacterized membrane protein (DUF2068 family)|nr:DUF2127 domain-containing protein [Gemmatimonadota bacterium]